MSKSFFVTAATLLQGSVLLLNIPLQDLQKEAFWIFGIAAIIVLLFLLITVKEKNIYVLSYEKLGKNGGKILSIIYIVYFLLAASYSINLLTSFTGGYVLEETPKIIITAFITLLCTYGAYAGSENLFRLGSIFFAISLLSGVVNIFLLRGKLSFNNLLPIFTFKPEEYFKTFIISITILFCDSSVFLCFLKKQEDKKNFILGLLVGTVFLVITLLCSGAALGRVLQIYTWPTHETLRIINSGNTLARIETSSVFIMISMVFFKVSLLMCAAIEGIKKTTPESKHILNTMCVGVVVFVMSVLLFKSGAAALYGFRRYAALIVLPLSAVIPCTLNVIKTRKNKENKKI